MQTKIHNYFDFEITNQKGEKVQTAHAENIVLNSLLKYAAGGMAYFNYIHVGSGTAEPTEDDTQLETFLSAKSASLSGISVDWDTMIFTARKSIIFQADELVGESISEVGVANSSSVGSLCTRALVKDENGNTISITKSDTEVLTIHATIFADLSSVEQNGIYISRYTDSDNILSASILPVPAAHALGIAKLFNKGGIFAYDFDNTAYNIELSTSTAGNTFKYTFPDITVNEYNDMSVMVIKLYKNGLCMKVPNNNFVQPRIENEIIAVGDGAAMNFNTKFRCISSSVPTVVKVDGIEADNVTINYNIPKTAEQAFRLYDYPKKYSSDDQKPLTPVPLFGVGWVRGINGSWSIYENMCNEMINISECRFNSCRIFLSDDLVSWSEIKSGVSIEENLRSSRYWKIVTSSSYVPITSMTYTSVSDIVFDVPPAEGSEITVDYNPDCIAKDSEHILRGIEFSITFSGG